MYTSTALASLLCLLTSSTTALYIPRRNIHHSVARQDDEIESLISDSPLLSLHRDLVDIESVDLLFFL